MEKVKIKILGLSCADKKGGNTAWMVDYSLKSVAKFGRRIGEAVEISTEFLDLSETETKPLPAMEESWNIPGSSPSGETHGDYFDTEVKPRVIGADGFIFGSSVHNTSFSSQFKLVVERFHPLLRQGHLTNKPATSIAVGYEILWGLETCLLDMNNCLRALEMIVCTRLTGCPISTVLRPEEEKGSPVAAAKKDRYGQWLAVSQARRVAEVAVKQKIAKRRLGSIYDKEFIQLYHPSSREEPWSWWRLDPKEEDFMMGL